MSLIMKMIHEKSKNERHKVEMHVISLTINLEKIFQIGSVNNKFGTHIQGTLNFWI